MRHFFIINPSAGRENSSRRLMEEIRHVFTPAEFVIAVTTGPGDARRLAQRAVDSGEDTRIYACGGDGTLNEVVNAAAGVDHVAVTNVPLGTGNDFLRIFGSEERKAFRDLRRLRSGPQAQFDLMDCNGYLGIDVICAGVDARVATEVHRYKRLPMVGGTMAYVMSLIWNVGKGITRPMKVDMGPIHHDGQTAILCICNGRHYGGGFCPVPEAQPDDGVLDMLLVGDVSRLKFARHVPAYAKGHYKECGGFIRDWHGQEVRFSAPREFPVVVDGEELRGRDFTVRLSEKKLNFFYPKGLFWRESSQSANK